LKERWLPILASPLVAILLYLPTLRHEFVFDDRGVIEQNPLLRNASDLPRVAVTPYWNSPGHVGSLYRPVTSLSFALDRIVAGGLKPAWFHLVNVVLHGLATLLVALLALEVLPGAAAPALAGLLFAVHPVHVESVAGVVGRSEILAACCALGAVLAHRRASFASVPAARRWAVLSWGASLLGMFSKESAVVTPLLCALGERPRACAEPSAVRRRWLYGGQIVVLGLYLAVRGLVLGTLGVGGAIPFVDNPAASAGALDGRLTAAACLPRYAALLLFPVRLSADYSFDQIPVVRSLFDPWALGGILILVLVLLTGAWALREGSPVGFALLWMAVAASTTTNLVMFIGTLLAERLMYLPSVGVCLLAAWSGGWLWRRGRALAVIVISSIVCVAGAWRSWARLPDWHDDFSLYQSAARVSPRSARIRYNLGNAYLRLQDGAHAETEYRSALAIYPEYNDARINLAMAILDQGRAPEALGLLAAAASRQPRSADLAVNLGAAYRALGDTARAESEFRRALAVDPDSARAWNDLGSIALARGDTLGALERLESAVRLDPSEPIFRINLADALTAAGREGEADRQFAEAVRLGPDLPEARRGLGEMAMHRGDVETAEREFRAAAGARRPSARAANFLGYLLTRRGDARGAAQEYEKALSIDPSLADAHRSLGLLYAEKLEDPARGARELRRSLELDPDQPDAAELRRLLAKLTLRKGS
jgi:protein O-mannosyl-transferase